MMLCLPTGGGKSTVMSAYVKKVMAKNKRTIFVVHRKELVKQFAQRLWSQFQMLSGIIMARFTPDYTKLTQVASIQSATRRQLPDTDLIIVDEAHRIKSNSYVQLLNQYPDAYVIYLTATPFRADGKGFEDMVDAIVQPTSIMELINDGFLVPTKVFGTERKVDVSDVGIRAGDFKSEELYSKYNDMASYNDVVVNYLLHGKGKKAVCFNVNVEHSKNQNEYFKRAGVPSAHVDGTTPQAERDRIFKQFSAGKILVLNNVDIVTEGVDVPDVEVVILNRATKSLNFYVQAVGRGLRPLLDSNYQIIRNPDGSPKKPHCIVLDHGENTMRHGFVEDYDKTRFTVDGRKKKKKGDQEPVLKECTNCYAMIPLFAQICPECDFKFERKTAELKLTDGTKLVLLDRDAVTIERLRGMDWKKAKEVPLHHLRLVAHLKGYNPAWWFHTAIDSGQVFVDKNEPGARKRVRTLLELEEIKYGTKNLVNRVGLYSDQIVRN